MLFNKKLPIASLWQGKNFDFNLNQTDKEDIFLELKDFNVKNIKSLQVKGYIKRINNQIQLQLKIRSVITQICGITTEDIETILNLDINKEYIITSNTKKYEAVEEVIVDPFEEEVEILDKDYISIKELVIEELALNINPYVYKNDCKFESYIEEDTSLNNTSPFSILLSSKESKKLN